MIEMSYQFRSKIGRATDERILVMKEILAGMRIIKMYCWEKPFLLLITKLRR